MPGPPELLPGPPRPAAPGLWKAVRAAGGGKVGSKLMMRAYGAETRMGDTGDEDKLDSLSAMLWPLPPTSPLVGSLMPS